MWYGILIGVVFWQLVLFTLSRFINDEDTFIVFSGFLFYAPAIAIVKTYKWIYTALMAATYYAATIYMFPEDKPPLSYGTVLVRKRDRNLYREELEFPAPDTYSIEIDHDPRLSCYRFAPRIRKDRIIIRKTTVASDMIQQAAKTSGWVAQHLYKN